MDVVPIKGIEVYISVTYGYIKVLKRIFNVDMDACDEQTNFHKIKD